MDAVATAKLALESSGLDKGLESASASLDKFAKRATSALAGAFAFDKLISGFSNAIEKGDQLQDLANRFGISASAIQEVGNAASLSGAGVEDVAGAMNKLAINAGKAIGGNKEMVKSFEDIGLSVDQLKGMSPQDIFFALSKSVAGAADPLVAFAQAQAVAGKNVGALMETLRMGPETIANFGQAMGTMSDEQIAKLSMASDAIKTFQNTITMSFGMILTDYLFPLIKDIQIMLDLFGQFVAVGQELGKGNFAGAGAIFEGMSRSESRARVAQQSQPIPKPTGVMNAEEASSGDMAAGLADNSVSKAISMPSSMSVEVFNNIYGEVRAIKTGLVQMQDLMEKRLGVPILRSAS